MDRGLASLCWRCPGLRLHSVQSIHRFINGGEGFDTLKENVVLDDRGASSTDNLLLGQYLRNELHVLSTIMLRYYQTVGATQTRKAGRRVAASLTLWPS